MLAQTQKELIYLKSQQKIYQSRIAKIKELLLQSGISGLEEQAGEELKVLKKNLTEQALLAWEQLSDFSYDLPSLFEIPQILAHLYWRFSQCMNLDYLQLTLKEAMCNNSSSWKVYFLKGLDKQNFIINERTYPLHKIRPCKQITFHQEKSYNIHSFVAVPLFYLGENLGVIGLACKKSYNWQELGEVFYLQLARILARRTYSLCAQKQEEQITLNFAEFAREILQPYKQEARLRGIELDYSFSSTLLKEVRPYLLSELRQWLNLLAKDTLEKNKESIIRLNFYEKEGKPCVQILSINSPCLLGEELAKYLKERDNFPIIQKKRNTYSLEITFTPCPV